MAGWKPEIKAGMPEKAGEEHDGSRIGGVFTNCIRGNIANRGFPNVFNVKQ